MNKKILALLLALVMVLGLAACGGSNAPAQTDAPAADAPATDAPAADAPAEDTPAEGPVKLRLVMYGDNTTRKDEFFKNEFHQKVLDELNIDFTIEWLPWSEMNGSTIINMLASGESLAFENIISLNDFHIKGYLAEIPMESIEANMPNYLDMRGQNNGFDCAKYQGKVYSIPIGNKAYAGAHQTITVRNEILNEVDWDAADITTYEDFMQAIAAVKEKYPNITVMRGTDALRCSLADHLVDGMACGEFVDNYVFVNENEDNDTVYSWYESDLFKNYVSMIEEWVELGYQGEDVITNPGQPAADWTAGNALCMYGTAGNLIETGVKAAFPDADLKNIKIGDAPLIKTRDYDWGISIAAGDADKIDSWLKLFDWIYASEENYNFCIYGVEGKDWEMGEDGKVKKLVDDTFWDDWFLQASKYVKFDASISQENIDAYMANDDGSKISKLSGFTFDPKNVETEVALLSAVKTEYMDPIFYGFLSYEENYEDALVALKEAGLDKYVAEYQRQYSEWRAANP